MPNNPVGGGRRPGEAWLDRFRGLSPERRQEGLLDLIRGQLALTLGRRADDIDTGRTFPELGVYQERAAEFRWRLSEAAQTALPATLLFDYPDPVSMAGFLERLLTGQDDPVPADAMAASGNLREPIAIIATACRFPGGVSSPAEFWDLVASGTDAVTGLPVDRGWDLGALYDPDQDHAGTTYVREGCFLADVAGFDAGFFGIAPREALAMDPQQRLMLEVCWETLENAGIDPAELRNTPAGAFIGSNWQDYLSAARLHLPADAEGYLVTGSAPSVLSGRLAYHFGFHGPAITVDTACSSSLVALHLACQALRLGECTLALAGGVAVMSSPESFVSFSRKKVLAPDGRCKAYGRGANGTSWGEGAGLLLLERLADARARGHPVLALVRGSAVNSDGASNGLTAPNGPAQERVIRQALAAAGLTPADVDAVEGHGTGTALGDPIEVRALMATYGAARDREHPLWLGSVKSNIGHTQAAAGAASVIKMVESLGHGVLPPTLHAARATPHVDWSAGTVRVLSEPVPWPRRDRPRRAAVSAFGISGTNAHLILEEADSAPGGVTTSPAPAQAESQPATGSQPVAVPWVLSARDETALRAQAARVREFALAGQGTGMSATDVGWSLATERHMFEHRTVAVGSGIDVLADRLALVARGEPTAGVVTGVARPGPGRAVFVFPGQGGQWLGMGGELLRSSPVFAAEIERCEQALAPWVDWSLPDVLRGTPGAPSLDRLDVVQPALFSVMMALAGLWRWFGVTPVAVVGHSQGEIPAAFVAGGLSLADAAKVVALRSEILRAALAGRGAMLSLPLSAHEAAELLADGAHQAEIAAVNSPRSVVVSADRDVLAALQAECEARRIRAKLVPASVPSHSSHVTQLHAELRAALSALEPRVPATPFYSTCTGGWVESAAFDAEYWYQNLREPVRFHDAIASLARSGHGPFIEVSPHPVLTRAMEETLAETDRRTVVTGSLRRADGGMDRMLLSVGEVCAGGQPVDWSRAFVPARPSASRARTSLPTYPFQHDRFWVEPGERPAADRSASDDRWYQVVWKPVPAAEGTAGTAGTWLALVPAGEAGEEWTRAALTGLAGAAERVVIVEVAPGTGRGELAGQIRSALSGTGPRSTGSAAGQLAPAGVVSLLALGELPLPARPGIPAGTAATLAAAQALGDEGVAAPLWIITRGAVAVGTADPLLRPLQAQAWGIGRVLGLEHPRRWGGLVDLPEVLDRAAIRRWLAAMGGIGAEDQLAVRASGIYVRRLVRGRPAGPAVSPGRPRRAGPAEGPRRPGWQPRGTVLITGGTGVLGRRVARWLAHGGAPHLVLASRSGRRAPGLEDLRAELAALGTVVTVEECDVRDRDAVRRLLTVASEAHPLSAIVHLAGIGRLQALTDITEADLAEVLEAKATGARHLHELTVDAGLDAFIMFSAVSATWGSGRQAAYGAANTYLDALARHRRAQGLAATTVCWGAWAQAGMGVVDASEDALRRRGLPPGSWAEAGMTQEEAAAETFGGWGLRMTAPEIMIAALQQVMDAGETAITVVDVDWPKFAATFTAARPRPLLQDLLDVRQALREHSDAAAAPADAVPWAGRLAVLPPAEQDRQVAELVRAHVAAVLGHASTAAIQMDQPLLDAGLDSATAVELRNKLGVATGLRLPATVVIDHPTPAALARVIRDQLLGPPPDPAATVLADLARLEASLAALAAAGGDLAPATTRLADLLRRRGGPEPAGAAPPDLETATMSEVLGLLDEELRLSGHTGPASPAGHHRPRSTEGGPA
jgi:polyketide synthase 7